MVVVRSQHQSTRRSSFTIAVITIVALFMVIHAYDIANPAGYMIDYATLYQASHSILRGDFLGSNYVPGVPLLAEHFSLTAYLTAWVALLPANIAYLAWWGFYYAVLVIFTARLARELHTPWLLPLLIAYPLSALNNPPENYMWVVLTPIGVALTWLGDYTYGLPALAIGFAGIEYVGPFIAFAMDVTRSIHRLVVAGEKRIPWVAIGSVPVVIAQAAWLTWARSLAGVHAGALATVIPDSGFNALSLVGKFIGYAMQVGLIPLVLYPPALLLALINYAPLAYASPIYTMPGYYIAPFYYALVTYTAFTASSIRLGRRLSLPVNFLAALALVMVFTYAMTLQLRGIDALAPPASYLVIAQALESTVKNATGVYLTNGLVCGYPPTWVVLHCVPYTQTILYYSLNGTMYGPWNATVIGWVYPFFNLTNPLLNLNPPFKFTHYSVAYAVLMNGTVLQIAKLSVGDVNMTVTPSEFLTMYMRGLAVNVAWALLITALIAAVTYRWLRRL